MGGLAITFRVVKVIVYPKGVKEYRYMIHKADDKPFQDAMKNCESVKVLGFIAEDKEYDKVIHAKER